ncbi:MAG: EamA-like transporter family protein [Leptolyngbya sp.]|uniref:EamA-like transporter family protein n=1 Tax=Shackletoniella antarctica TaxID=268115 RepID=A0A2W4Y447_9CYAN|nr:MAG: EamA-like transporter family protein [Shackletoniella antarctica]PZV15648.1 MAG: EamA-like transporter family protein [Leptolyngbya sp.]
MTVQEFALLFVAVLASALGQLFLKLGALQLGQVTGANAIGHILSIATTPALVAGLMAYGVGAILYILVLTRVELSVAAPAAAMIYLASVIIGAVVFKESLSFGRLAGLGLIMSGVVLVATR